MTIENDTTIERCDGCGFEIERGAAGCHELFEELLAQDFSNPQYFHVHRMMVDTYCLQHPDRYCRSAKSLAAHLGGICSILEGDADAAMGAEAVREWLDGSSPVERPEVPSSRGDLTIAHIRESTSPEEHASRVEEWARSTWQAYATLHELARSWVEQATSQQSGSTCADGRRAGKRVQCRVDTTLDACATL